MIIVVGGPTGSGKTALAMKLAKQFDAVIINGDAFQVYRDFNIGTAKPTLDVRKEVKHYLFDFVTPGDDYNVKVYQEQFRNIVKELQEKGTNIIVVGGTGLYQKAAFFDYVFEDENEGVDLSDLLLLNDRDLHNILREIDPVEAARTHMNNRKRVIRAISVYRRHGKTKTEMNAEQEHKLIIDAKFVALDIDRGELNVRLDKRVDEMVELGLVDEVRHLLKVYRRDAHAFQAIGYKEIVQYLDGKITLEQAINTVKAETRDYAKRQVTFYRNQLPVTWYKTIELAYKGIIKDIQDEAKKNKEKTKTEKVEDIADKI